jgi:hypothetical protein
MREIVVGPINTIAGVQFLNVWFRFPVVAARQPYYGTLQTAYNPTAPGDYANADLAEVSAFRTGAWVERAGFQDVIDPTSTLVQIQTRLANLYGAAAAQFLSGDNATLARWNSSWDGTTWTMKSA